MQAYNQGVIIPPATIGILGGGQLGRMLALCAREMGYDIVCLDPTPQSPCGQVADRQITADFHSLTGARELAKLSDVITYEFENISGEIAKILEKESYLPQGYRLLQITQNRLREKQAIEERGAQVVTYRQVQSTEDLFRGAAELGLPVVLKTAEGGYDGKGQQVIRTEEQLTEVARQLTLADDPNLIWVMEKFIAFAKELSVIVARNPRGECFPFPVTENIHVQNILHLSIAPARISSEIQLKAQQIAVSLAERFDLVGLLAVEMFLLPSGELLINELAPRPHNSGHLTAQACSISQFAQHIRAICNLPLSEPRLIQPTVMVNILGKHLPQVLNRLSEFKGNFVVHLYGKKDVRPNRKMGHINVMAETVDQALKDIWQTGIWEMEGIL